VARAVVSAHRGEVGADSLVAYVVLRADGSAGPEALRQHVAAHLPDVMVPAHVVVLDVLPLTPNGKVDRNALPAPSTVAFAAPGGPPLAGGPAASPIHLTGAAEELVAAVWTEVLGRPVGRDDNFFELGGHSLLAVRVFRRLTDATDAPLALTDIFRFPTVRSLAAHIERVAAGPDAGTAVAGDDRAAAGPGTDAGSDRGARRRQAMARRSTEEPGSS
jgi:acyl carrier protein